MKNISGKINVNHFFEKLFEVFIPQKMYSHIAASMNMFEAFLVQIDF